MSPRTPRPLTRLVLAGAVASLLLGSPPAGADPAETDVAPIEPARQCAGDPPRQTADPLSPPCIPSFDGDNGCATYAIGVTCDEVRILVYLDGGINYVTASDPTNAVAPEQALYDLWKSPAENNEANGDAPTQPEHLTVKGLRVWQ